MPSPRSAPVFDFTSADPIESTDAARQLERMRSPRDDRLARCHRQIDHAL